jgi:hypothetical protein
MENIFKKGMLEKSDEELIAILTSAKGTYVPEMMKAAESEREKRNLIIEQSQIVHGKEETSNPHLQTQLPSKRKTYDNYGELTDVEVQREVLLTQRLALEKLEKIRENTSYLVWCFMIIIIAGVLLAMFFRYKLNQMGMP